MSSVKAVKKLRETILRQVQEAVDLFPKTLVAVELICAVPEESEEGEGPVFLHRGGWRPCIILRWDWDDVNRKAVLLTPEGMFTTRLSLTFPSEDEGGKPEWYPNWQERKPAARRDWDAYGAQAGFAVANLHLEG